jgi:hypothetical protein
MDLYLTVTHSCCRASQPINRYTKNTISGPQVGSVCHVCAPSVGCRCAIPVQYIVKPAYGMHGYAGKWITCRSTANQASNRQMDYKLSANLKHPSCTDSVEGLLRRLIRYYVEAVTCGGNYGQIVSVFL